MTNDDRIGILRAVDPFATMPDEALAALAAKFRLEHYEPGATVFEEGDPGDRLFVAVSGAAEISTGGGASRTPLATLEPGELVGELALLTQVTTRNATLTALSELVLLSLAAADLDVLFLAHPETRTAFEQHAEELLKARFIKSVGPFMTLDDLARRSLAKRVSRHTVSAGEAIMRQGETGDSCFLVRSGKLEAVSSAGTPDERVLASLGPATLVGEAALLTDQPRTATVRATETCEVLEIHRSVLEEVIDRGRSGVGRELVRLFRLQERPRRAKGVLLSEREAPGGGTLTILKHPEHLTYFRLSPRGRFVWERLDGYHDLRALTLDFFHEFHQFSPHEIAQIIDRLARTRMIETSSLSEGFGEPLVTPSRLTRLLRRVRSLVTQEVALKNVDARISVAYERGARLLFTRVAQVGLAIVAAAGLLAFVLVSGRAHRVLGTAHKELQLLFLPGFVAGAFVHEAAHAFTVKAFGRCVNRCGVGWYWFSPVVFVDTSDMWLGSRRQRIVVSLAGPYANVILAGAESLIALAVPNDVAAACLWSLALPNLLTALANLNPLLEYDGYHVLSDVLDRPNLRSEALSWFGKNFPAVLRDPQRLRNHATDLLYGIGSALYVIGLAAVTIVLYRLTLQSLIEGLLPTSTAAGLAWVFALTVSLLALLGLIADLWHRRLAQQG